MKIKDFFVPFFFITTPISTFSQSFEWGGQFGGLGEDVIKNMYVDPSGNSYITGYFTDTADFDISGNEYNLTSIGLEDVFIQKTDMHGNLIWAFAVGGPLSEYGTAITTDDEGNVYITGYFEGTADFDPGIGESLHNSKGEGDIFILKLNNNGHFVWAKTIGGPGYEESTSIDLDESGNIYILGYLNETVDFDPGPSEVIISSHGGSDTFLLKLNPWGEYINVYSYGGNETDLALNMSVKNNSQIFISGFFTGTTDLDPRPNEEYLITSSGLSSGYIMQINEDGAIVNVTHTQGGEIIVYACTIDINNNMYITGSFNGTVNFDPASGNTDFTFTSDSSYNGFIMKVFQDGSIAWVRHFTSEDNLIPYDIIIGQDNKVYSTGFFDGTADFNPSATDDFFLTPQSMNFFDAYLLILTENGIFDQAYQFGGVNTVDTHQLGIDINNNIYLAAQFETTVDLNPILNHSLNATALDFRDNYLIKMNLGTLDVPSSQNGNFFIYPNPTNQFILMKSPNLNGQYYSIYNQLGQKVSEGILTQNQRINVEFLNTGIYLFKPQNHPPVKFIKN